jgi:hypothetical protein
MIIKVADYAAAPAVLNSVFDTLIFIVISLRIMSFSYRDGHSTTRAGIFFRGDGLSKISRALLQGGQLYYLFGPLSSHPYCNLYILSISATITLNIATVIMLLSSAPSALRSVLCMPNLALESAIACCVFRQLRIGFMTDFDATASKDFTCICFAQQSRPLVVVPTSESSLGTRSFENACHGGIHVEVTKRTESQEYRDLSTGAPISRVLVKDLV